MADKGPPRPYFELPTLANDKGPLLLSSADLEKAKGQVAFFLEHLPPLEYEDVNGPHEDVLFECFKRGFIGIDPGMRIAMEAMDLSRNDRSPLLLEGEEGTELLEAAQCIHDLGDSSAERAFDWLRGPFAPFYWEEQISEVLEDNDNGTLYVARIDAAPPEMQRTLLKLVEQERIRLIASAQDPLDLAVDEGFFLQDLLAAFKQKNPIAIPPLCMRPGDIPLLLYLQIRAFNLNRKRRSAHSAAPDQDVELISLSALYTALAHRWQGNTRQFKNTVLRELDEVYKETPFLDLSPSPPDWSFAPDPLAEFRNTPEKLSFEIGELHLDELLSRVKIESMLFEADRLALPDCRYLWTYAQRQNQLEEERKASAEEPESQGAAIEAVDNAGEKAGIMEDEIEGQEEAPPVPQAEDRGFHHAPDYQTVRFRGTTYYLTPRCARAIEELHKAYKKGWPSMRFRDLIDAVSENRDTTYTSAGAFLRNTAKDDKGERLKIWKNLVMPGKVKGSVRLNID